MQQKAAFSLATRLLLVAGVSLLTACATPRQQASFDYTALRESRPASILVLPPLNNSPEVEASDSVYSSVTMPLAESGYYVFPVTLVRESFRQNGLDHPADIHQVALDKLRRLGWIAPGAWISVETARGEVLDVKGFELDATRDSGKARLHLLRLAA